MMEAVKKLPGRSPQAVRRKLQRLRPLSKGLAATWRRKALELDARVQRLEEERASCQLLYSAIKEFAPKSYKTHIAAPKIKQTGVKSQSAVLLFSDCHVGQEVRPGQTLGIGEYNQKIFLQRLSTLEASVLNILTRHTVAPIDELVVAVLGDLIDGNLDHGLVECTNVPLIQQIHVAAHAIAQFFARLSAVLPKIRIEAVVGNHGRWPGQKQMPVINRCSNLDFFTLLYAKALTRDCPRISWRLTEQPRAIFEVNGFRFLAFHGDEVRGGDYIFRLPIQGLGRFVSSLTQFRLASHQPPISHVLLGHFHRSFELPFVGGSIIANGSFVGPDELAVARSLPYTRPEQVVFLIHPEHGRTATYHVFLDRHSNTIPYTLPLF